jgi:cytochrome c oxidase assembly protein Cox11
MNEIISHPWFADIDFEALLRKEIVPPYKPDQEQMTIKENEIIEMKYDTTNLKDIKVEDETDEIPLEKRLLIHQNQGKFTDF